ncbi:hypothetical protein A0H81_08031 [Grifola frondosa]|uniref:Uncharacterized protein n=1 Tax=Grifola frondosa TaxID=5627 RepID=A0A1C7M576_GRIFR|nr:hypothetical protein A0H81_08031 [Grifola frondosa]
MNTTLELELRGASDERFWMARRRRLTRAVTAPSASSNSSRLSTRRRAPAVESGSASMPTVPSRCLSDDAVVSIPAISDGHFHGSPTPDPDLDDVVLVAVDNGNVVTSSSDLQPPAHTNPSVKPHISLDNLSLHSPSSIVGTPFELSPRFEYPFPLSSEMETDTTLSSPLSTLSSPLTPLNNPLAFTIPFTTGLPSFPLSSAPRHRSELHSHSPTHPKLHPRDPPVPPGLVKKRRTIMGSTEVRGRGGSAHDPPPVDDCSAPVSSRTHAGEKNERSSLERRLSDSTIVNGSDDDHKVDLVLEYEMGSKGGHRPP